MDRHQAVSGILRGFFTGASWMRLAMWAKAGNGTREIVVSLSYREGALWRLTLKEHESERWTGESSTLEDLTAQAVVSIGKGF